MLTLAVTLIAMNAKAQNNELRLQAETRIDYSGEFLKSDDTNDKMGFNGRYLNVMLSGTIDEHFSYAYRQRLRNIYLSVAIFAASIMLLPTSDALFNALRPHQQNRIMSFLGVSSDFNIDFNVNQSKIAIGSGGFTGTGFLKGSQIRYNFVPEKHTDFIFCTIGEEWGFVGAILVLALIAALIYRLMWLGDRQSEAFGRVYCYCVASMLFFHTLVNVGMTIGVIPVMGIPLPLISYGGSSLVAFTVMIFIAFALDASSNHDDMSRSGSRWR